MAPPAIVSTGGRAVVSPRFCCAGGERTIITNHQLSQLNVTTRLYVDSASNNSGNGPRKQTARWCHLGGGGSLVGQIRRRAPYVMHTWSLNRIRYDRSGVISESLLHLYVCSK